MARSTVGVALVALLAAACCVQARPMAAAAGPLCNGTPVMGSYGGEKANGGLHSFEGNCGTILNQLCAPCKLWDAGMVKSNACLTQPQNCAKGFWTTGHSVLPRIPIRGIEDMTATTAPAVTKAAEIWEQAWEHTIQSGAATESTAALVINSANYRSEHQMHIHFGAMDKNFEISCVTSVPSGVTTFAAAQTFPCQVPRWVNTGCKAGAAGCHDGWEVKGTKTALIKAITVPHLTNVWGDYVAGAAHRPAGADAYHTGLAVARAPGQPGKWLVIMFSSDSPGAGGVGDHEMLHY